MASVQGPGKRGDEEFVYTQTKTQKGLYKRIDNCIKAIRSSDLPAMQRTKEIAKLEKMKKAVDSLESRKVVKVIRELDKLEQMQKGKQLSTPAKIEEVQQLGELKYINDRIDRCIAAAQKSSLPAEDIEVDIMSLNQMKTRHPDFKQLTEFELSEIEETYGLKEIS